MGAGLVSLTQRMRRFKEKEVAPGGSMEAASRLTMGVLTVREFLVERARCWRSSVTVNPDSAHARAKVLESVRLRILK